MPSSVSSIAEIYQVTLSDALSAHEEAMAYGGRQGVANLSLIESAIGRPYHGYYDSLEEMAAALLESMVKNHGFVDGNKRTAWLLTATFIDRSGYTLDLADDERVDDFVVGVAEGGIAFADAVAWFSARLRPTD